MIQKWCYNTNIIYTFPSYSWSCRIGWVYTPWEEYCFSKFHYKQVQRSKYSFRGNTAPRKRQEKKDQRSPSDPGPTLFRRASATRAIGPSRKSPVAICTSRRCATIQRPLEDPRLEAGTVSSDGSGLSG